MKKIKDMSKEELIEFLTEKEAQFNPKDNKPVLLELALSLDEEEEEEDSEEEIEEDSGEGSSDSEEEEFEVDASEPKEFPSYMYSKNGPRLFKSAEEFKEASLEEDFQDTPLK